MEGPYRRFRTLIQPLFVTLALVGCATQSRMAPIEGRTTTPPERAAPAPVRPAAKVAPPPTPAVDTQVFALPDTAAMPTAPVPVPDADANGTIPLPPVATPSDPALRELVAQAESASARGDRGAARATLERALKIKPGDGRLWLRLGELNYADGEYEQAVVMAQRARELARGDPALVAQSQSLIERAGARLTP